MLKKKIIGFDIDGVLTDYGTFLLNEGSKWLGKRVACAEGEEIHDTFDESIKTENEFWRDHLRDYFGNCPTRQYTAEIMNKLHEKYEIHIITNRYGEDNLSQKDVEKITREWLKKNKITYDLLVFNSGSKLGCCKSGSVDIMIEDNVAHINEISKHIPVVCFDARYNKECKGKNVHRCYSMYDLYIICNNLL